MHCRMGQDGLSPLPDFDSIYLIELPPHVKIEHNYKIDMFFVLQYRKTNLWDSNGTFMIHLADNYVS